MRRPATLSLLATLLLFTLPAAAQPMPCAARDEVLSVIEDRLGQSIRARARAGAAVMELFVNTDTDTWTIAVSLRDGRTCLLANGTGFEVADTLLPARGIPV